MDGHDARPGTARTGAGPRHVVVTPVRRRARRGVGAGSPGPATARSDDLLARAEELLPEARRWCPACDAPVGRGRAGRPGRLRGTCTACGTGFDLGPDLRPGTVLDGPRAGRVTVTGLLARGGAWLYTGRDRAGEDVVIARRRDGDAATAEPLCGLRHPALVPVRDVVPHHAGGDDAAVLLVLGRVEGDPPRPPLDPVDAARVVLAVAPALALLHARGLLHADVKPGNVLLTAAGPVLADLGSVRRHDDAVSPVWGTEGFLAPEIAPGGAGPSTASEVYALGRTLDVLLGRPARPHLAPAVPVPPPTALDPVVRRATATDPTLRHPDVLSLADDIRSRFTRSEHPMPVGLGRTEGPEPVHQDVRHRTHHPRGAFPT